ncbi:hypothetical protein F4780DRAFT_766273, partial [Xylariomycetidae sp. FL0641]
MTQDSLKLPKQMPSTNHEVIVFMEGMYMSLGEVDTTPRSHEVISYHRITDAEEIRQRIQCASIVIVIQSVISAESLGEAPYLKCVISPTAGMNHVDVEECHRRGIKVTSSPGSTSPAVADHALSLYFAARRKTVMLHNDMRTLDENGQNTWKRLGTAAGLMLTANGQPPFSLDQEVAGIIGHGNIGQSHLTHPALRPSST